MSIFDCRSYHKIFHDSFAHCTIMVSNHFHPDAQKRCWRNKVCNHFSGQKPIHPGEIEVGQGPTRGKGGFGLEMVNMKSWHDVVAWWWHETWKDKHAVSFFQACSNQDDKHAVSKTTGFSWKIGGVQGGLCFRPSCGFQSPTKTATRNSSPGGNGVFDTVYMYIYN